MARIREHAVLDSIREAAHPLEGGARDYDPLLKMIGDARFVLLGEASHGTHEFYKERATITKRLITEKGFNTIAVEADWPDALRIHRHVTAQSDDNAAIDSLADFQRFPAWMWRNADVLDFIGWLRAHNDSQPSGQKTGFFGMDLYSLFSSIQQVIRYLEQHDPAAAQQAKRRYACFEDFADDPQVYGMTSSQHISLSCEEEVIRQLVVLQKRTSDCIRNGQPCAEESFFAEQNARVAKNAEQYYRSMYRGRPSSWNLRDQHMVESIDALCEYTRQQHREPKVIVWAHNSHLGDARATEMGQRGEWNVGQLIRQKYGAESVLVGFSTNSGTVTAARDWDTPAERRRVREGMPGSFENLFHQVDQSRFMLLLRDDARLREALSEQRNQRAIGVIYRPETERYSHYFLSHLPYQFDAMLHFDVTRALEPLERTPLWIGGETPDTYPSGL
ncbi:MAG TPA: erythromycin esterase family protein [Methylomirabilota bacterium]|nr:erythromycin esterase family protein [Methylomirabilota bacterium]